MRMYNMLTEGAPRPGGVSTDEPGMGGGAI